LSFAPAAPDMTTRLDRTGLPDAIRTIADARRVQLLATRRTGDRAGSAAISVAISIADPLHCLGAIVAVQRLGGDAFLCDPQWPDAELSAAIEPIGPDAILRDRDAAPIAPGPAPRRSRRSRRTDRDPYIAIPTGGTTGQKRFACHTWATLAASAIGVRAAFQHDRIDSFCCLPTFHVSGLAQFVRAIVTGGRLALATPRAIRSDRPPPDGDFGGFWLSLVPTQLQRAIEVPEWCAWLRQFDVIFLGGAPAWPDLLDRGRNAGLRLAPTFGMTETASQIATLHPDEFLAGRVGCGRALPHAEIAIAPDPEAAGESPPLASGSFGEIGTIAIRARSLCHGYYDPATGRARPLSSDRYWRSDDLGYLDRDGRLYVTGRASQKLIAGGENVYPEEVEAAIRATGLVADVAVFGLPDREWGQVLAAVCVARGSVGDVGDGIDRDRLVAQIRDRLTARLARYKIPKRWRLLDALPRNDRGKLDRSALPDRFAD